MADDILGTPAGANKPFYVYVYRDPRPQKGNQPIYVGKGTASQGRAYVHWNQGPRNAILLRIFAKIKAEGMRPIIEIAGWFDDELEAFAFESALIAQFGRRDISTGTLANMTDGGDGAANPSQEARAAVGAAVRLRWMNQESRSRGVEATRESWMNEEIRKRRADGIVAALTPDDVRAAMSARTLLQWQDEALRTLRISRTRDVRSTPESRAVTATRSTALWADPLHRVRVSGTLSRTLSSPEKRAAMASRASSVWAALTPEKREARLAGLRASVSRRVARAALAASVGK